MNERGPDDCMHTLFGLWGAESMVGLVSVSTGVYVIEVVQKGDQERV